MRSDMSTRPVIYRAKKILTLDHAMPDADAIADRLAVAEREIEIGVRRIDDDRARRFARRIIDELLLQVCRQFLRRPFLGLVFRRQ